MVPVPAAIRPPSGLNATEYTDASRTAHDRSSRPVATSQTLTLPSSPPTARAWPSGWNATADTPSRAGPGSRRSRRRSAASHSLIDSPRPPAEATTRPPAAQPAPQVVGQRPGGRVAPRRLLGHRLQADRLQVARNLAVDGPRPNRLRRAHLFEQDFARAGEGRPAGQHLVEHDAEGVHVGAA